MSKKPLLSVGRISKAHGIRGEVRVVFHADSPDLLTGDVYLAPPGSLDGGTVPVTIRILSTRMDKTHMLARLEGVADRTAAEKLRGYELLIAEDALPPLQEGEAYVHQLYGLAVSVRDEQERETKLGTITDVSFPAGQEIWTIETPTGEAILFPAVPDFVHALDIVESRVVITPPPGLLELYTQ